MLSIPHFTQRFSNSCRHATLIMLAAVLLLNACTAEQAAELAPLQTSAVRQGDLIQSASGTAVLVAPVRIDLSFSTNGTVGEVMVQVGETITAGQPLAVLDDLTALELAVQKEQLALNLANQALDKLLASGEANLAQALADVSSSQAALSEAQKNHHQKGDSRCATSLTQDYFFEYFLAQQRVTEWEGYLNDPDTGYGQDYILQKLAPMRNERDQAYANYTYCQGYTEQEILTSDSSLEVARTNLAQTEKKYAELLDHSGLDMAKINLARAEVKNSELQLRKAEAMLSGATLLSPIDGTVISISAAAGERVTGGELFMTIADLNQPAVQINIDESDLVNIATGCRAEVIFDALPNRTFNGSVTLVSPVLVSVEDVEMVQGMVELGDAGVNPKHALMLNQSGSVDVICSEARDVLIVPLEALVKDGTGSTYVYVITGSNIQKRPVEVGLRNTAFAEIRSGLEQGEQVVTTTADLK